MAIAAARCGRGLGVRQAAARFASTLQPPAPNAASASRPPAIATFFMNISCWIICCSAGIAQ